MCAGFVYSQILFACVRLKLFELLAAAPCTAAEIAERLKLPRASTDRLLEAAVSLRLVEQRGDDRFGLGALGAALMGNPGVGAMIEHHSLLYADLHDPIGLLRGEKSATNLGQYWAYSQAAAPAALPGARTADYTALMSRSQPLVAAEVLDAYPLERHRTLLDVGGGDGSFLLEAGKRCAKLELMLFDLPAVADLARERLRAAGLAPRSRVLGGDFLREELPRGADVLSLIRVVHDHSEEGAAALLGAAHRALPANGVLLLAEPMLGTPDARTVGEAYFGFYLLAMGRGRARKPRELKDMLRHAGFDAARLLRTRQPLQTRLIVAQKKARRDRTVHNS